MAGLFFMQFSFFLLGTFESLSILIIILIGKRQKNISKIKRAVVKLGEVNLPIKDLG